MTQKWRKPNPHARMASQKMKAPMMTRPSILSGRDIYPTRREKSARAALTALRSAAVGFELRHAV
jgi:hypothetical protein